MATDAEIGNLLSSVPPPAARTTPAAAEPPAPPPVPRHVAAGEATGRLDPAFFHYLQKDEAAFSKLSADMQIALLRKHGASIGEGVSLGEGAVVRAESMHIGDGVRFGAGVRIDCGELAIGKISQFGARTSIRARKFKCGENAYFAPDVEIGGGGCIDPEAECRVGSHGFVGEHVHINPCRPVVIGDEVIISRGAVVMTHSFGGNVLNGYPSRFAGVTLGDRSQIGIHVVIFPGVDVGEGCVVLSNSSLVTSVPDGRLFGGVPARDLRAAAAMPDAEERWQMARDLALEFARQLSLRGLETSTTASADEVLIIIKRGRAQHRLHVARELKSRDEDLVAEDIRAGLDAGTAFESLHPELTGIDLGGARIRGPMGPLASAFREFLRKRGVRLHPRTWTYPGGWL